MVCVNDLEGQGEEMLLTEKLYDREDPIPKGSEREI